VSGFGLRKESLCPIQRIGRGGRGRRELQRLVAQMPLHIYSEFAEAREHAGVQSGGRQVATPLATVQTLAQEFRSRGWRGGATAHDGHVFVTPHGNPRVKIGKDARRRWGLVRQPRFSPGEF
jgi:hypothetical protein